MKKLLFSAAALTVLCSAQGAFAQDSSAFGGPYVGAQLSVARLQDKHTDFQDWYNGVRDFGMSKTSVMGGVRAGYDWVSGSLIAGALAEVNFGKLDTFRETSPVDPQYAIGAKIKMLGSVRGKLGITSGKLAGFATAGFAFADTDHRYRETDGTGEFFNGHGSRTGWVLGVGGAYALDPHSSIGLDLSHYQFGSRDHIILAPNGSPRIGSSASDGFYHWRMKDQVESVALSYNYRF